MGWRAAVMVLVAALAGSCADAGDDPVPTGEEEPIAEPADATTIRQERLAAVEHWLYLIDVDLEEATVAAITASDHDMVVLDFIPSEQQNTDYPMADVVAELRDAERPKLVLAYVDIGQAEDYRVYWEDGWQIGDPDWIVATDPDGWEGNFPVAYWRAEWQDLWVGDEGLVGQIGAAGFDGIYLDWIEAYDDENVVAAAAAEGRDPAAAMVEWVAALTEAGREENPGFLVIGQNAAELAVADAAYRATIDAIAQEQVWFDGGADNDPPGDCPLPATDDDIESAAYVASLSEGCLRLYEEFPDSTLHVSSEWYLESLLPLSEELPVFTVDYALDPANVEWVLAESRRLGFVPFVGGRALDRFEPVR